MSIVPTSSLVDPVIICSLASKTLVFNQRLVVNLLQEVDRLTNWSTFDNGVNDKVDKPQQTACCQPGCPHCKHPVNLNPQVTRSLDLFFYNVVSTGCIRDLDKLNLD